MASCVDTPLGWTLTESAIVPARVVGKNVVTVRCGAHQLYVTFTAGLARQVGIPRYAFASVRDDGRSYVFTLTNDPALDGGTFTLSFNGGSSKLQNSPSRILQFRREALLIAPGTYVPSFPAASPGLLAIAIEKDGALRSSRVRRG